MPQNTEYPNTCQKTQLPRLATMCLQCKKLNTIRNVEEIPIISNIRWAWELRCSGLVHSE